MCLQPVQALRLLAQEEMVKRKFGFLYSGYSLHYWETAEMIRKLALATIPVFIKVQPTGSLQVSDIEHTNVLAQEQRCHS